MKASLAYVLPLLSLLFVLLVRSYSLSLTSQIWSPKIAIHEFDLNGRKLRGIIATDDIEGDVARSFNFSCLILPFSTIELEIFLKVSVSSCLLALPNLKTARDGRYFHTKGEMYMKSIPLFLIYSFIYLRCLIIVFHFSLQTPKTIILKYNVRTMIQ